MSNRTGQVWMMKADPERIRIFVQHLPQLLGENEAHLALYVDEQVVEEMDTEALENDEEWERLA